MYHPRNEFQNAYDASRLDHVSPEVHETGSGDYGLKVFADWYCPHTDAYQGQDLIQVIRFETEAERQKYCDGLEGSDLDYKFFEKKLN
jgi:hypothetical protein